MNQRMMEQARAQDAPASSGACTTNELVGTVDDFVAVLSLLVQQRSTGLNTQPASHLNLSASK